METPATYYNDLMIRYFSGEASPEEIAGLSAWVGQSEENRQAFEAFHQSWLMVEQLALDNSIDLDREWADMQAVLDSKQGGRIIRADFERPGRSRLFKRVAAVAAVIIVLVSSFFVIRYFATQEGETTYVASDQVLEKILNDGSRVSLSPGSQLSMQPQFRGDKREVKLNGEAYFEVAHDEAHPFVVNAGQRVSIEVLGTTFYVNSCNDSNRVEVVLLEGRVAVYYNDRPEERQILHPGERAELSLSTPTFEKTAPADQNFLAWKTGKLVFTGTRLDQVVRLLNKTYHADVRLADPALAGLTITATFNNQSLESVLKVVKETLSLQVKKQGKTYLITPSTDNAGL